MNQFSCPGGMGGQVWSVWLWFSPSGSLVPFNINRHPMGPTVWEQSLVALCPTSCEVLEICDNLFGLVYSYWTTESWLRKTSAMLIVFSWYICPAGREGQWLSLCSLTCSFASLIAAPMEAGWHAVRVRPLLCPPAAVVHSVVSSQERQWHLHRNCTKN